VPNRRKLFFAHLPVRNSYPRLRNSFFYHHSFMLNCFHIIMQIIALSAAIYLTLHCFLQNFSVVFNNISLNRVPFARCFFNKAHISYPAHCHIESSRNRGSRKSKYIHSRKFLFNFFLLCNTEALLFINYKKSQIFKLDCFAQKFMSSYYHINRTISKALQYLFLLFCRHKA